MNQILYFFVNTAMVFLIPYMLYKLFAFYKLKKLFYLLIFLLSLFLLLSIAMVGFVPAGSESRRKISSTKSNMHKLDSILEEYGLQKNKYPKDIEELEKYLKESNSVHYPLLIKNSFNNKIGKGQSFDNLNKLVKKPNGGFYGKEGVVYYNPIMQKNNDCSKYFIYGAGLKNELILEQNKNIPYTISND